MTDEADGDTVIRIYKLYFDLDGAEPPAGFPEVSAISTMSSR